MSDLVFEAFLEEQFKGGMELADQSDLLDLTPVDRDRYLAQFHCKGLIRNGSGEIVEADESLVGIWFPPDFLRGVDPYVVLTWLGPMNAWHPNIRPPGICAGRVTPGTELVNLLYQCYEIITYHNWAAHDALNRQASQWARNNQERFPIDGRPLKRRELQLTVRADSEDQTES